jgi:hypothetical protein
MPSARNWLRDRRASARWKSLKSRSPISSSSQPRCASDSVLSASSSSSSARSTASLTAVGGIGPNDSTNVTFLSGFWNGKTWRLVAAK